MIGEIGMDFYWAKNVSKSAQEKVFRYILEHCHNHKKFCLIHTKGAEKEILENAIERSITQCYALEGTYPADLAYLEQHYGLIYDKEQFFVMYEYIGGNLRPSITIIERE